MNYRWTLSLAIAVFVLFVTTRPLSAAEADQDPKGIEFFEKKIRPVLIESCYECHSRQAKSVKGGLLLDTRAGIRKGGESGAAVVPGNATDSLLLEALRHEGLEMPPDRKLADDVIADFTKWVKLGAPDPRDGKAGVARKAIDVDEARKFWAFQRPVKHALPQVKQADWPKNDIDRFILAPLEAEKIKPVGDADRWTLLRRATLDLTGLPPTPEEAEAFLNDASPKAFEKVIDRLLASPQFGERWGRHWLDVARYAESTGKERNVPYPYAWRYRDYVIDAFNADKPYDRFIREQIAGDLLAFETGDQRNEQLIATGFLAIGTRGLNERNREQFAMDVVDEQLDAATRAVLALTITCARCHDHKFDPVPTADYYALAGIFRSTVTLSGVKQGNNKAGYGGEFAALVNTQEPEEQSAPSSGAEPREIQSLEEELTEARAELKKAAAKVPSKNAKNNQKRKKQLQASTRQVRLRIRELETKLAELREDPAKSTTSEEVAMGVADAPRPVNCRINIRGEVNDLGPEVPRGFAAVLTWPGAPAIDSNQNQSGRLPLAEWLTSRENPLTARVMVNRIWYHLFGTGIVGTVDNFGELGERPTHPELLDHLAVRFMEEGWSVKRLIREIMLSRVYQLASGHQPANYAVDPQNRLYWRMNRRRLDAEVIRDALLSASGQLDLSRPAGSPVMQMAGAEIGRGANTAVLRQTGNYRSVYLPILRGIVPEILNIFDVADPNLVVGQRDVTTVATQALYMMNNPFVAEQSEATARRVLENADLDDAGRADLAFRLALGRPATDAERQRAVEFIHEYQQSLAEDRRGKSADPTAAWSSFCQALFASAEFRYVY